MKFFEMCQIKSVQLSQNPLKVNWLIDMQVNKMKKEMKKKKPLANQKLLTDTNK